MEAWNELEAAIFGFGCAARRLSRKRQGQRRRGSQDCGGNAGTGLPAYCTRNAITELIEAARRAGTILATRGQIASVKIEPPRTTGSQPLTSYNCDAISREHPIAAGETLRGELRLPPLQQGNTPRTKTHPDPSRLAAVTWGKRLRLHHFLRFQGALGPKTGGNRGLLFTDEYMGLILKPFIALRLHGKLPLPGAGFWGEGGTP